MARVLPLFVATSLAVGCIPGRDNPVDPANALEPVLRVVDYTPASYSPSAGSPCAVTVGTSARLAPTVSAASRGHCLAVLVLSTDLHGSAVDHAEVEYLGLDDDSAPVSLGVDALTAEIPVALRRAAPVGRALTFRAQVSGEGKRGVATTTLVLLNSAPTARTGPAFVVPLGGYAWSADEPVLVSLRQEGSFDPDGDDLEYCWTVPGEDEVCADDPEDPALTIAVDATDERRIVSELMVRDGGDAAAPESLRSRVAHFEIFVESPGAWIFGQTETLFDNTPRMHRLATGERSLDGDALGASFLAPTALVPSADGSPAAIALLVYRTDGSVALALASSEDLTVGPAYELVLNQNLPRFATNRGGTESKVLQKESGELVLRGVAADTATLAIADVGQPVAVTDASGDCGSGGAPAYAVRVDASGNSWLQTGDSNVQFVAKGASQSVTVLETDCESRIVGFAERPATGEMWVTKTAISSPAVAPRSVLHVFAAGVLVDTFELDPADSLNGIAFVDEHEMWAVVPDFGLVLIDADLLAVGRPLADTLLVAHGDLVELGANAVLVDRTTGTAWMYGQGAGVGGWLEAHRSGDAQLHRAIDLRMFTVIDEEGRLWSGDGYGSVFRSRSPREIGEVTASAPLLSETVFEDSVVFDPSDGGVWVEARFPRRLVHIAPDGRERRIAEVTGDLDAFSTRLASNRISPDGRRLWIVPSVSQGSTAAMGMYVLDVTQTPAVAKKLLDASDAQWLFGDGAHAVNQEFGDFRVFEPSAPVPGSTPFAWTFRGADGSNAFPGEIHAVNADGSGGGAAIWSLDLSAYPDGVSGVSGALSARDNELCLVSRSSTGPKHWTVERLAPVPGATPEALGVLPAPSATPTPPFVTFEMEYEERAASASSATARVCWAGISQKRNTVVNTGMGLSITPLSAGWSVAAFDSTGEIHRYDSAYGASGLLSITAISPDEIWVVEGDVAPPYRTRLHKLRFDEGDLAPAEIRTHVISGRVIRNAGQQ